MKLFKKCLTAALALCLLLSCLSGADAIGEWYYPPQFPSSGACGPDARYEIADGVLTISGTGPVTTLLADLPSSVTKVVIEEGITALIPDASMAFQPNIAQVELPESLVYVGRLAFNGSAWLEGLKNEFTIVGNGILIDYNGPGGKVTLPEGVRFVATDAFYGTAVTELELGASVYVSDGVWGLEGCEKLEKVTTGGNPVTFAERSPWLETDVQTDENDKTLSSRRFLVMDGVLLACQGLDGAVTVPEEVRSIASGGLYGEFLELTIPATVTELAPKAIRGSELDSGSPVLVRAAADGAVQRYLETDEGWLYRFMPVGQDNSSLLNFIKRNEYYAGKFPDVATDKWYHEVVGVVYELGLMQGNADGTFIPGGGIRLSEAITVAARVRDIYYDGQTDFTTDGKWYQPYVDYAVANGMLAEAPADLNRPATRAEFAALLAAALPEKELEAVHEELTFTDAAETHPSYAAIMALSRAGVMQGRGEGIFDPDSPVKRCEAAAMLSRCIRPEQRIGM